MKTIDLPQDLWELLEQLRQEMENGDTPICADLTARAFEAEEMGDRESAAKLNRLAEALN
jgi:CheY-like chemotaxis protein